MKNEDSGERREGSILGDPGAVSRVAGIFVGESLL